MKQAVELERLTSIDKQVLAGLIPNEPDVAAGQGRTRAEESVVVDLTPVAAGIATRRTKPHKDFADWQPACAAGLASAMAGGQWPQVRRCAVKSWGVTDKN